MKNALRHTIVVSTMAIVLVAVLMYCITPDVLDAWLSAMRYRAAQVLRPVSVGRLVSAVSGRVSSGDEGRAGAAAARQPPQPAGNPVDALRQRYGPNGSGPLRKLGQPAARAGDPGRADGVVVRAVDETARKVEPEDFHEGTENGRVPGKAGATYGGLARTMGIYISIAFLISVQAACLTVFISLQRRERAENRRRHFMDCLERALLQSMDPGEARHPSVTNHAGRS